MLIGLLLLVVGAVIGWWAHSEGEHFWMMLGMVIMFVGFLCYAFTFEPGRGEPARWVPMEHSQNR